MRVIIVGFFLGGYVSMWVLISFFYEFLLTQIMLHVTS